MLPVRVEKPTQDTINLQYSFTYIFIKKPPLCQEVSPVAMIVLNILKRCFLDLTGIISYILTENILIMFKIR